MKVNFRIVPLVLGLALTGCAHSPAYDPEFNKGYESKPQGSIFYSDGRLAFYGDAAEALFNDIKSKPLPLPNGNVLKPAETQTVSIQCAKLKYPRQENSWFYSCGIGAQELTKTKQ
jgi:hypothetical protein